MGTKPNRSRKLTPEYNKPEVEENQKDLPGMRLRDYHILIGNCVFVPLAL